MSARKMTPAQVLREIAESDPVGHGQRLARAYGVGPEPTVQVPVSLLRDAHGLIRHSDTYSDERAEQIQARLGTLLSQPTPTAEPMGALDARLDALGLRDPDEPARPDSLTFPHAKADKMLAAPPSIADMVPGATFERVTRERWTVARGAITGQLIAESGSDICYLDDIDPSTIRDVTPPSTESTK